MRLLETFKNQTARHVLPGLPAGSFMALSTSDPARDTIGQKTMMTSQLSGCVSSTWGDDHFLPVMVFMMAESAPHASAVTTRPTFTVENQKLPAVEQFRLVAEEDEDLLLFDCSICRKRLADSKTHRCCSTAQFPVAFCYSFLSLFPVLDGRRLDASPHASSPFSLTDHQGFHTDRLASSCWNEPFQIHSLSPSRRLPEHLEPEETKCPSSKPNVLSSSAQLRG